MGDFRKPSFGGGRGGGFRGGGRPSFGGPRREERGEMFDATCSKCSKECQVPFRPNGKKPVFCKECFVRPEGDAPRSFDKRDAPRSFDRSADRPRDERPAYVAAKATPDPRIDALKRDIETLTTKVESILELLRAQARQTAIEQAVAPIKTPVKKVVKAKTKKK
jgi:CxxC-x17-CxxC domain-containing protein